MSLLASKSRDQIKALRHRAESFTLTNDQRGYDAFWSDDELVELYLEPGRIRNFRLVAARCREIRGACIDLGCGVGTMLAMLQAEDRQADKALFGLDYSEAAIEQSRRRVPRGHFSVGDVYATRFGDESFGLVLSIQTMEHLAHPRLAAAEIWRLLKPGGTAIVTVPNGAIDQWEGHVNFWTPQSFVDMFGQQPTVIERINDDRNLLFEFAKAA